MRGPDRHHQPQAANFPVFSRETGNSETETGSPMTASTARCIDFSGAAKAVARKRVASVSLSPFRLFAATGLDSLASDDGGDVKYGILKKAGATGPGLYSLNPTLRRGLTPFGTNPA